MIHQKRKIMTNRWVFPSFKIYMSESNVNSKELLHDSFRSVDNLRHFRCFPSLNYLEKIIELMRNNDFPFVMWRIQSDDELLKVLLFLIMRHCDVPLATIPHWYSINRRLSLMIWPLVGCRYFYETLQSNLKLRVKSTMKYISPVNYDALLSLNLQTITNHANDAGWN